MAFLGKTKIGTKLILGFVTMITLLILTGAVSLVSMNSLTSKLSRTLDYESRLAETSSTAFAATGSIGQYERDILLNVKFAAQRDSSIILSWESEVAGMASRFEVLESMFKDLNRQDEIDFLNEARSYLEKHTMGFRDLVAKIDSGKIRTADEASIAFRPYKSDGASMEFIVRGMTTRAIRHLQEARESVNTVTRWSRITVAAGVLISVILGIAVSFMIAAGIRAPLNELVTNLKESNTKLVSINHELEEAHNAAERDMKIAVNVQRSLLQKNPPRSSEWDVAFDFRPKSGVSGDFYEFYTDNDRLIGAGIFDVSGHGISSGLITMLSKSIINRNFVAYQNEPLFKVIKRINAELIRELGGVDNYLTGILLRFTGDNVEYVNAGHTELVLKRSGVEAKIIQPKDDNIKGSFLGVAEMGSQFRSLNFKAMKDDCFLMYSDCIIEATNPQGESYGLDRLIKHLNTVDPDVSASTMVSSVVDELYLYTESKTLNDDLTLLAIKKF